MEFISSKKTSYCIKHIITNCFMMYASL